ncbi:MAG: tetratricopeptide (TPR) repeat protein [Bradymonadia bacterium]
MGFFSKFTRPAWEKAAGKAELCARKGEDGAAVRLYDEALIKAPDDQKPRLQEARTTIAVRVCAINLEEGEKRENAGHLERALDHYELAEEFATDDDSKAASKAALNRIAVLRRDANDTAKKPAFQNEDLELDDDQTYGILIGSMPDEVADEYEEQDAGFRQAYMAMNRGEIDKAIEYFRSRGDAHAPSLVELGRCLRGIGELKESIETFAKVEPLRPKWNFARLQAAEVCWRAKDLDRAEEFLQNAVDEDDEDPAVYVAICRTAVMRGTPDYGLEAAEAGLEIAPTDRALKLLKARLCELDGRLEEAMEGYEKRIGETWRYDAQEGKLFMDSEAVYLAAHLYRRTGENPKRAAELFRGLMAFSDPAERWQHELGLADVLVSSGDQDGANQILTELERVVPEQDKLAHCRILKLQGNEERFSAALGALSAPERAVWDQIEAERAA